ncbi:unnamed protein product [Lactuca saligna]|uniref:Histone acetyltransferase n=1 Tax=Lactuca saligna TaxID=75948 RepID=A0AA35Z4I1_LACSI|nr:unnamed protein product [Lactuca saligna]
MPRPGPRPFECVRRSWHSERHQPIRGSIIQQIFRVVHENHSPGTKKNREWQEKLPLVVLKSEEIMYSKANSEAEYVNPETLWDRLNDAIDTIIRKDDTMENGDFLPACVEAALNLGCVQVRSSRSQRNSNTRSYLSSRNQDYGRNLNVPNVQRPDSEANKDIRPNSNFTPPGSSFYPPSFENFPRNMVSIENKTSSIYPLYHGFHLQPRPPHMGFHTTPQNSGSIIHGTPVFRAARAACEPSHSERLFSFDRDNDDGNGSGSKKESGPELVECDLSLRLGPVSSSEKEKGLTCVDDDVDLGRLKGKEFSFFPLNSEGEGVENLGTDVRKRKMTCNPDSFSNSSCLFLPTTIATPAPPTTITATIIRYFIFDQYGGCKFS